MPTRKIKARKNSIPNMNMGLQIMVKGKIATMTGISPSPAFANELLLIKAMLNFINQKCGTKYKIVAG